MPRTASDLSTCGHLRVVRKTLDKEMSPLGKDPTDTAEGTEVSSGEDMQGVETAVQGGSR